MKRTYLALALFFGVLSVTHSQNHGRKTSGGIKGGYNLAAVSFDGDAETDRRHGFHIGVYGESFVNQNVSIQPELLYSQQGYEIKDASGTFKQKLDYINFPVMLKIYPSNNFFLEAGPQIGLAINHKEEYDGFFSSSQEFEPDNFDWGMNFGAGFKTNSSLSFGVRYHLGLGDLYDSNKAYNRVWQFYVGLDL